MKIHILSLYLFIGLSFNSFSQNSILNPSFELGIDSGYVFTNHSHITYTLYNGRGVISDSALHFSISSNSNLPAPQKLIIKTKPFGAPSTSALRFLFNSSVTGKSIQIWVNGAVTKKHTVNLEKGWKYYNLNLDMGEPDGNGQYQLLFRVGTLPVNQTFALDELWLGAPVNLPQENVYVSPIGEDKIGNGSLSSPFKTIAYASKWVTGDHIYLLEGNYHLSDTIQGLNKKLYVKPYNGKVTFDGTITISDNLWQVHSGDIYKAKINEPVSQLFENGEMLNAARWPNVDGYIEDEQPISKDPLKKSLWDKYNSWAKSAKISTKGEMHTEANETPNLLSDLSFSIAGAMAVLNVGSFKSHTATVTNHTIGENSFSYDISTVNHWEKPEKSYYFLEGKLEFLDQAGEWFFDLEDSTLYVYSKNGGQPTEIKGKTKTFAVVIKDCQKGVSLDQFDFFGTTIKVMKSPYSEVKNCHFSYPSASVRMLHQIPQYNDVTEFDKFSHHSHIENNIFEYIEGEALHTTGEYVIIKNNLFKHIDFSCSQLRNIGGTINLLGDYTTFSHNTVYVAGASETLTPGTGAIIEYNEGWSIGHVQNDGAFIQFMTGNVIGSIVRYNWIHNMVKSGLRYDGPLESLGTAPGELQTKGKIYGNVFWNTPNAFVVKGDFHIVTNNTTFNNNNGIALIDLSQGGSNTQFKPSNHGSSCKNNLCEQVLGERGRHDRTPINYPIPGEHSNNWNGYYYTDTTVLDMMQDYKNRDFRPINSVLLVDAGSNDIASTFDPNHKPSHQKIGSFYDIGAYEYSDPNYYIPGMMGKKATNPIPVDKDTSWSSYVMLAWKSAYLAKEYKVYLGTNSKDVASSNQPFAITSSNNTSAPDMSENEVFYWRVEAIYESGEVVTGDVWQFVAGKDSKTTVVGLQDDFKNENKDFSIHPNPINEGLLYFSKELTNVMILDSKGRVLYKMEKGGFVSTEFLSTGFYYLKSNEGGMSFVVE